MIANRNFRLGSQQHPHSQKKQLTPLYIFISASFELSLYSWIDGLDDDIQWNGVFLLRVHSDKKNVDSPRKIPSHRVAKASTYWMTEDYKTCIDLVDSITEVPCIMLSIYLVMHNKLVCHKVERTHWINQHIIHASITGFMPVYSLGKRKKAHWLS